MSLLLLKSLSKKVVNKLSENTDKPLVSVIILNYNGRSSLVSTIFETCLASVLQCTNVNYEVLFVDNGSTDDSVEFVNMKFGTDKRLKIIQNGKNLGFAEGNNVAIPYAKGKYILFLNDDVIVSPLFLSELVQTMELNPQIGACSCREKRGAVGMSCDIYGFPITRFDDSSQVFYVPGWALLTRRDLVTKIGAFDAKYFAFAEDLDFCWRVRLAGYQIAVNPNAVAYHLGGGTLKIEGISENDDAVEFHFSLKRSGLFERNIIRTLIKNYSVTNILVIVPKYLALQTTESLVSIYLAGLSVFRNVYLQALIWNIKNFRDTWLTRQLVQSFRKVSDSEIQKSMVKGSVKIYYYKKLLKKGQLPKLVSKK